MISWWICILAGLGFINAGYIQYKKSHHEKLQCMIGAEDCNLVVNSKYNTMFGVPNEILGMLFYATVAGIVVFNNVVAQTVQGVSVALLLFVFESFALVFSIYLTFIQAAVLKHWCQYCILSALINLIMWGITLFVHLV